jgi:hypothetical protein
MSIQYKLNGIVSGVLLGLQADSLVTTRQSQVNATFAGFEGDRHAGITRKSDGRTPFYPRGSEMRNDRQVSIVSVEELAQIAAALGLPALRAEWLGANLVLEGIPRLTQLPPGARLFLGGGAVLVVQSENLPCINPGKVIAAEVGQPGLAEKFVKAAHCRRGLVACVEMPAVIQSGEGVIAEVYSQVIYNPLV